MIPRRIFIGDIKLCIKYKKSLIFSDTTIVNNESVGADYYGYLAKSDKVYKRNAILIQINDNCYLDITDVNSFMDLLKLYYDIVINIRHLNRLIIRTSPSSKNILYVDREFLTQYYGDVSTYNEESIPRLKRDIRR